MDAIFELLQREFCPPLDSSLLAALLADIDPVTLTDPPSTSDPHIAALRSTLIQLAAHADEARDELFDWSNSDETETDFCTTTTTTATTSASDSSAGTPRAAFASPLGFLQAALPHIPRAALVQALADANVHDEDDAVDIWAVVAGLLDAEAARELQERDLDADEVAELQAEAAWATVEPRKPKGKGKRKANKPAGTIRITLSDVRQQQHVVAPIGPRSVDHDPWAQLASLATHVASLLPPHPPAYFLSFFHSPEHAWTPYAALCAALTALSLRIDAEDPDTQDTTTLFALLDALLPAYSALDPARLLADAERALAAAQGRAEDAFELVRVLRDLDADAAEQHVIGVFHALPPATSRSSPTSPRTASPISPRVPTRLPTGPAPTPPPPLPARSASAPSERANGGGWHAVPTRRRPPVRATHPLAAHIPAYDVDVSGVRVKPRGSGSGSGAKGASGVANAAARASLRRRDELLREAARMWQRGSARTRSGEVAFYFAERAREFQEIARREALDAARAMVAKRRSGDTVDLHGVTAAEAVVIVEEILRERQWSAERPLKIITGRGAHSAGRVSVLKPAVRRALEGDGWVVGAWEGGLVVRGRR
ncbi:hypothetical protein B0H10DRAFT_2034899 [Mycena sp. CBHHK59/15]|nr:hypothetical protein B0H10DRAFT_2034899 [Mycena sp. CBHHK59/15]